jgi:hypothetical protein
MLYLLAVGRIRQGAIGQHPVHIKHDQLNCAGFLFYDIGQMYHNCILKTLMREYGLQQPTRQSRNIVRYCNAFVRAVLSAAQCSDNKE